MANHVQTTFRGQFLTLLGHQRALIRFELDRDVDDLVGDGHFHIQLDSHRLPQKEGVAIHNVPPVFAQMKRDAVRPAKLRLDSRPDRVGLIRQSGLPYRRNVIDIHSEFSHDRIVSG